MCMASSAVQLSQTEMALCGIIICHPQSQTSLHGKNYHSGQSCSPVLQILVPLLRVPLSLSVTVNELQWRHSLPDRESVNWDWWLDFMAGCFQEGMLNQSGSTKNFFFKLTQVTVSQGAPCKMYPLWYFEFSSNVGYCLNGTEQSVNRAVYRYNKHTIPFMGILCPYWCRILIYWLMWTSGSYFQMCCNVRSIRNCWRRQKKWWKNRCLFGHK